MVETIHKVMAEHCDGKIIYSQLFVSAERLLAALGLCTLREYGALVAKNNDIKLDHSGHKIRNKYTCIT